MKLRFYLLFVLLLFCKAQGNTQVNLVPNPGFELFSTCPDYPDSPNYSGANAICLALPWFQPLNPNATPSDFGCGESSSDFWHTCTGNIPKVWTGLDYQFPNNGNGFTGIGLFNPSIPIETRESMEVPLKETLKTKHYCVSWSANLAGISGRGANGVGAFFSQDTVF